MGAVDLVVLALVERCEDAVAVRVDMDTYEELMPFVAGELYKRYVLDGGELNESDKGSG